MKVNSSGAHANVVKIQPNWEHMPVHFYVPNALMDLFCRQIHWTKKQIGSKQANEQKKINTSFHFKFTLRQLDNKIIPICALCQYYRCRRCSYTVSGKSILILLDRLFDELDMVDVNSIKDYEDYLKRYANVLHQNHYLMLSAKHSLCQLIGRSDGFLINELNLTQLQRKEEYCRDLLRVVNVLEPGASRLRGIICYELHAPMMIKITREFENRTINSNDRESVRKCLKEVNSI